MNGNNCYKIEAHNSLFKNELSQSAYACVDYVNINESLTSPLQIYPNPAQTEIFIKSELQIEKVEIFDVMGRAVATVETQCIASLQTQSDAHTINISNLPTGVYFIRIQTDGSAGSPTGGVITRKVIKSER